MGGADRRNPVRPGLVPLDTVSRHEPRCSSAKERRVVPKLDKSVTKYLSKRFLLLGGLNTILVTGKAGHNLEWKI